MWKTSKLLVEKKFTFCCECEIGAGTGDTKAESDARRRSIGTMKKAIEDGVLVISNPAKALSYCRELVQLLRAEDAGAALIEISYHHAFQSREQ